MLKRIYKELLFIRKDIAEIRKCMEREARIETDMQVRFVPYPQGRFLDESSKDELIRYQRTLYEVLNSCKGRDYNNIT